MNDFFACIALFQMLGWTTEYLTLAGEWGGSGERSRTRRREEESPEKYDTPSGTERYLSGAIYAIH